MSQKAVPQSLWWLSWFLTYGHACGRASGFDTKGLLTRASRFSHFLLEKDDVYIWLPPLLGCQEAGRGGLAVVLGPGKGPSSEMAAHLPDDQVGLGSKMGASGPFCFLLKTQKKKKNKAEKAMAPHSSTFAWKIPWTERPGGWQSMGLLESDMTEQLHFHFSL